MRVKRSLSVDNFKRHPAPLLSPLHRSQSPCSGPDNARAAALPSHDPIACVFANRCQVDLRRSHTMGRRSQRTSLARCQLPAAGPCICDRRSVLPAVLQFALFTPQSLARACFCPPTLSHPFEPGSVLHPLFSPPVSLFFSCFC